MAIEFHAYGAMIGLGIVVAVEIVVRAIKRYQVSQINEKDVYGVLWWVLVGGILGARTYHIIDWWDYYRIDWWRMIEVWNGGMGIFGGLAGGLGGMWWGAKVRRINFWKMVDLASLGMIMAQAIGRWGNYFNQELYGLPTKLPWGWRIDEGKRVMAVAGEERFHPLFFYEFLWNGLGYFLLRWGLEKRVWMIGKGQVWGWYLMWYGWGRFWLEYLRIEPWKVMIGRGEIAVAQLWSVGIMVVGAAIYFGVRWRGNDNRNKKQQGKED